MKTCIIINPNAGSAGQAEAVYRAISPLEDVHCVESTEAGEGWQRAIEALSNGAECIVAAGGDGTVRDVASGVLDHGSGIFGVVPLGTGNDLARTLALPLDPLDALAVLRLARVETIDTIHVQSDSLDTVAINAVSGGFSGQLDEVLTTEMKQKFGPLAYPLGAVQVLPELTAYEAALHYDALPPESAPLYNIVIANGRTIGGGKCVAPVADVQDGLLDVVLVKACEVVHLADMAARLLAGTILESPQVAHRRVERVALTAQPGMWLNIDGERLTDEPATFTVQPGSLRVIVGPDFGKP